MTINIKITPTQKINVKTQIAVPENLSGVDNVDIDNIQDGYVLMYDDERQRYAFVDPDYLLNKSVEDDSLPSNFIEKLGKDLDNLIDVDSGTF